jgi:hypothetical protein
VVAIDRNEWSASIGIGGRDQSEMVVGISRNMHVVKLDARKMRI